MATQNNVTNDWNAVISSAQQQLAQIDAERKQLEASVAKYQPAIDAAKQKLATATAEYNAASAIKIVPSLTDVVNAENAWKADPNNVTLKAAYEKTQLAFQSSKAIRDAALAKADSAFKAAQAELSKANSLSDAETRRAIELEDTRTQLEQNIAYAKQQLALQAAQTNSTNTATVSATTIPASSSPGNATVATATAATTSTTATPPTTTDPSAPSQSVTDIAGNFFGNTTAPPPVTDPNSVAGISAEFFNSQANAAPYATGSAVGLSASTFVAESTATAQDNANFNAFKDWRVRLTLAPDAQYLYRATESGILAPLAATDGVVFPYTPQINVTYAATYEPTKVTHTNYAIQQYTNSSVDNITITADFTAQDTYEANYLLATIHFFKSMTKMFYGQDKFPKNGTPPPLCYMFGLGGFQFEAHPMAITSFTYNLPIDVDYIRTTTTIASTAKRGGTVQGNDRLPPGVMPGGTASPAQFNSDGQGSSPTYVPTRIQMIIGCVPVMSRNAISNRFSLADYATGKLMLGSKNPGGGIW